MNWRQDAGYPPSRSGPGIRRAASLLAIGALLVIGGCDGARDTDPVVVSDSAGVELVLTTVGVDEMLGVEATVVRTLGGKETPEEAFYRVADAGVATDGSGGIYVLDRASSRVQTFDSEGLHVRTVGSEGAGPGELRFPLSLAAAPDGRLWVADAGNRALVHWAANGELLASVAMPQGYAGGAVEWVRDGLLVPVRTLEHYRLMHVGLEAENEVLFHMPRGEGRVLDLQSCGMGFSGLTPIFAPDLLWATDGTTVAVARNPSYVVDLYEEGRLVRSVRRALPLREATAALAVESLGEGMRVGTPAGPRVCDSAEVVEQRGFAPHLPSIRNLALAPDGTLWVKRFEASQVGEAIDLYDASGRYIGTLPGDTPFPIGFLPDGHLMTVDTDDFDVERLVVQELTLVPAN